jgi:DUF1365 family protein
MNRLPRRARIEPSLLARQLEAWVDEYQDHNTAFDAYMKGDRKPRTDSEIDELVRSLRRR